MKKKILIAACMLPFVSNLNAKNSDTKCVNPLIQSIESSDKSSQDLFPSGVWATLRGDVRFSSLIGPQDERTTLKIKSDPSSQKFDTFKVTRSLERDRNFMLAVDGSHLGITLGVDVFPGWKTNWNLSVGTLTSEIGVRENFIKFGHMSFGELRLGDTDGIADGSEAFLDGHDHGRLLSSFTAPGKYVGVTTGVLAHNGLGGNALDMKSNATKITYLSPRLEGFQVGVSFTPNSQRTGEDALKAGHPDGENAEPFAVNVLGIEGNFQQKISESVKVSVSATAALGDVKSEKSDQGDLNRHNLKSIGIGATLKIGDFRAAGTFVNNFNTGQMKEDVADVNPAEKDHNKTLTPQTYSADKATAGKVASLGLGLKLGEGWYVGLGVLKGWRNTGFGDDNAVGKSFTCRANYKINKNVMLGAEVGHHDFQNPYGIYESTLKATQNKDVDIEHIGNQKALTFVLSTRIKF